MEQVIEHPAGSAGFVQVGEQRMMVAPVHNGPPPKYLIRNHDGKVFPYSDALAADGANFTPTNTLPESHLKEIRISRQREAEEAAAIQRAQIEQDAQKKLAGVKYQELLDEYIRQQQAPQLAQTAEEQLVVDEAVVTGSDLNKLVTYAKDEFKVEVKGNLDQIRGQVRFLQSKRRETMKQPAPATAA